MASSFVLVADERIPHLHYLVQQLADRGHRIETTETGPGAAHAIRRRRAAGTAYDLAILDLNLPQLDGIAVARDLRANGDPTPLVIHATGARSDASLLRMINGLPNVMLLDRPLTCEQIESAIASSRPGAGARVGTPPTLRGETPVGQAGWRYPSGEVRVPPTPAVERRPASGSAFTPIGPSAPGALDPHLRTPTPGAVQSGTGQIRRDTGISPITTGQIRRDAVRPPPTTARTNRAPGQPTSLPATQTTTTRIRRSVQGSVAAPPPHAPAAEPGSGGSRLVACAYCHGHFHVPWKGEGFVIACVHCGQMNRIDPLR